MKKENLIRYELLRAQSHELLHRVAATDAGAPHILCAIRKCRRDGGCVGPMMQSRHMGSAVRAQQALGMSGQACARLPACIAHQADDNFEVYKIYADRQRNSVAPGRLEPRRMRQLKSRPWPDPAATSLLTSNPYHPTSDAETKG